jgi:cysteine desulfurase/selenocysteine lyase
MDILTDDFFSFLCSSKQLDDSYARCRQAGVPVELPGYIAPVKEIAEIAHRYGARLFLDAAQSIPHLRVDPGDLGCDYMVFSSHKMLGPSGVGVLWGTEEGLEELGTPRRGGGMVNQVNCDGFEPRELPWRLEAGTPNIEGVIGFGEALNVLLELPADWVDEHLRRLTGLLVEAVDSTPNLRLLGPFESNERISLVSFEVLNPNTKCDQYAKILSDTFGIMTRSGSLCAHPLLSALDSHDAVRASLYIYNTQEEVEYFKEALTKLTYIF